MPRTIGRKIPANSPRGNFRSQCHYCGEDRYRSDLRKDATGFLSCPSCNDVGHDVTTLNKANAAMALKTTPVYPMDGLANPFDIDEVGEHIDSSSNGRKWGSGMKWGSSKKWGASEEPDIGI